MRKYKIIILALVTLSLIHCQHKAMVTHSGTAQGLRVLGYLHSPHDWISGINSIDLKGITDLNLAFINPDSLGNFTANPAYAQLIKKAHENHVRVFLSFGGGNAPAYLEKLMEAGKRQAFINGLAFIAENYGFDGIDVDLENSLINHNYASFVAGLSNVLKPKNILMTAALAGWNAHLIHDTTLAKFDFINIMSYDKTGPWNLSRPGQHSPYSMAQDDFNYFNKTRKLAAEKLFIGLPFYGYGFGNGAPQSMTYKNIVNTYPGSENNDSIALPGGGVIYYNGISTITQKVSYAIANKAGGVMIWQLMGDSRDAKSLLKTINDLKKK